MSERGRRRFVGFLLADPLVPTMDRTTGLFVLTLGSFVVGIAVLLYGEFSGARTFVFGGSGLVVLSVGLLTAIIAGLDDAEGPEGTP